MRTRAVAMKVKSSGKLCKDENQVNCIMMDEDESSSNEGKVSGSSGSSPADEYDKAPKLKGWEHVGNGAFKTKDDGKGTYDEVAEKGMSAKDCRKACAKSKKCQGYETSKGGQCELHEQRLQKVDNNKDFNCYNKGQDTGKDKGGSSNRKGKGGEINKLKETLVSDKDKSKDESKGKGKSEDKSKDG